MPLRAILALVASAATMPSGATTRVVDPIAALIREYSKEGTSAEYMQRDSDKTYARYVLNRPDFPYADEVVRALPSADEPTRRAVVTASTPERPVNQRDLHNMKVWDLGFTKARMGYDIHWLPAELYFPGAANAVKAGVEPDIYAQALRLTGGGYPAIAANYAVAAQLLRAKLASTPRQRWTERGLRQDVIDHFVHADDATKLSDFDLHYLIQLLDGAMAGWDVGHQSVYGLRELPLPFRVGRIAAAYRERNPYDDPPCLANGRYDPAQAGMGGFDRRPLCFGDATDRAVHAWYAGTLRDELSTRAVERMAAPLRSSRQGWIGVARPGAIGLASRKEVVEAKVANNLLVVGDLSYRDGSDATRRALHLTCKDEL
jgi:hypothetical protein